MPRLRRRNPLQKPTSATAVNYIIDEKNGIFYTVVYDARLVEQLSYRGRSLEPALLGAISVNADDRMSGAPRCTVDFAVARRGYGPLIYDLTARGLDLYVKGCKSLRPSATQSPYAQAFWKRIDAEELVPLGDDFFLAKYGRSASQMESRGRKMSRSRKISPSNQPLEEAAYEMIHKYVTVGGISDIRPVPLSQMLSRAGYVA
jgi:hypothetical protein